MGFSSDYPDISEWEAKPEGYQAGSVIKYKGNVFRAAFWASEPGAGDANSNGWRFFDELYDQTPHAKTDKAKIIAYIPTWRKAEGFGYGNFEMYQYLTHGIIAFLTFSETNPGGLDPASVADVGAVLPDVITAAKLSDTKIMVALGGANDYAFLDLMTAVGNDPAAPQLGQAVRSVADFVTGNGLAGVDLDLECWWGRPGGQDLGGRSKSDGPHPAGRGLTLFAEKLKEAMPEKIVSATTFGSSWYGNNYDPALADHVEWLGIMTYDLTGSWNRSPVGPHTTLRTIRGKATSDIRQSDTYQESYEPEQQGGWPSPAAGGKPPGDEANVADNPILSVEDSLWYWTNPLFVNWQGAGQGIAREKIAAGVPIYGYDFAAGKDPDDLTGQVPPGYKVMRYKDILAAFPEAHQASNAHIQVPGSTPRPVLADPLPPGEYPFAHNLYFETPDTAVTKLNFLKDVGAQGVIIWELSDDVWEDGKSIIKALYRASGHPEPEPVTHPPAVVSSRCLWDSTGFLGATASDLQFQDDGPIGPLVRQFSARLWNIPDGADWVTTAQNAPAVIKRQYFNRPTRIVDKGVAGLWGEFDVLNVDGVPDWFWGHMEREDETPPGFIRYRSRLWGLSLSDDWKAAARKTPAVVEGQYFDQPTDIDDRGIGGLYGIFDVKDEPATVPPLVGHVGGDNGCFYCVMSAESLPGNVVLTNTTTTMTVEPGTPFLYAVLTRGDGSADFPEDVIMRIQDPGGTFHDQDVNEGGRFVLMSGFSVRCLIIENPQPGTWTMRMSVPSGTDFHCECNAVPSADVFATMTRTRALLDGAQGVAPRGISFVKAFFGVAAAVAVVYVFPAYVAVLGSLVLGTALVGVHTAMPDATNAALGSQTMAAVAALQAEMVQKVLEKGWPAIQEYAFLIGKNISQEECMVALRNPQKVPRWLGVHREVFREVEHMTDAEEQNAVRHVYWQCLLKKRLGEEFAIAMGDAHERGRPGTAADNKADEENNKIGLKLADEVESDADCLAATKEKWKKKELAVREDTKTDPP
ncbi:glycoside hydrolase family 18 protein [Amycolatopsis sp. NPDC004378]